MPGGHKGVGRSAPGPVLVVGRDYDAQEARVGRPFVGPAGALLDKALLAAGRPRSSVLVTNVVNKQPRGNDFAAHSDADIAAGLRALHNLIESEQPERIIALGNQAAFACLDGAWPSKDGTIRGAEDIYVRRGFWQAGHAGVPVVAAVHPADCFPSRDPSGINELLLYADFKRALSIERPLDFPERRTHVPNSLSEAISYANNVRSHDGPVACDIECSPSELGCVGFALRVDEAYVFPARYGRQAASLLADPNVRKIFHHGSFDTYWLSTRLGVETAGYTDDTSVLWHALWPEIAGAGIGGSKRTHKRLHFLASLYTHTQWWKDYGWADEHEMCVLNGIDVMVTLECFERMLEEGESKDVLGIYRHEMRLMEPLRRISERGLAVDGRLLDERVQRLTTQGVGLNKKLQDDIHEIVLERRDRLSKQHLFFVRRTCPCCRGGDKKVVACWSCAGFERAPTKQMLLDAAKPWERRALAKLSKSELEERALGPCAACAGVGSWEEFEFNPGSPDQVRDLLFNVLRVPARASVDEATLKDLLGVLSEAE